METAQLLWCGDRVVVGGPKVGLRNGKTLAEDGFVQEEGAVTRVATMGNNMVTLNDAGSVAIWRLENGPASTPKCKDRFDLEGVAFFSWHTLGKKAITGFANCLKGDQKMKPHKVGDTILLLATSSQTNATVQVYNLRTKTLSTVKQVDGSLSHFAASSPDPHTLALGQGNTVTVVLFGNGETRQVQNQHRICSLAVHPYSHQVSLGDATGRIRTWIVPEMTMKEAHWHAHALSVLAWSPDGTTLVSGGEEAVLCLWNARSWTSNKIARLPGPIIAAAWKDDSSRLIVGCAPAGLLVVDVPQRKATTIVHGAELLLGQPCEAITPAPTAGGVCAALVGMQNVLRVFDPVSLKYLKTIKVNARNAVSRVDTATLPKLTVKQLAFSHGGDHLATFEESDVQLPSGYYDATLRFWNLSDAGTLDYNVNTFVSMPHEGGVVAILFSPNRRICVTVGADCTLKRWGFNGEYWAHMATTRLTGEAATCADMSPDGTVVSVGVDWGVQCVSVGTFEVLAELTQAVATAPLWSVHHLSTEGGADDAAATDSRFHLAATSESHVFMWDLTSSEARKGEGVLRYAVEVPVDAATTYKGTNLIVSAHGTFLFFAQTSPVPVRTMAATDAPVKSIFAPSGAGMILYISEEGKFQHVEKAQSDAFLGVAASDAAPAPAAKPAPPTSTAHATGARALSDIFGAASLPARPAALLPTHSLVAYQDPNATCKTLTMFYDGATHALQAPAPALGSLLDSLLTYS